MAGMLGADAFHCRGLDEKIWNVLAPSSAALSADRSRAPAIDVCNPIRTIFHNRGRSGMYLRIAILFAVAVAAFGANGRLYLKDGDYQIVREYEVLADRVRYFSTERGDWEEIPLELVDLDRTKKDAAERQAALETEAKQQDIEDKAIRAERKEAASVPQEPGA